MLLGEFMSMYEDIDTVKGDDVVYFYRMKYRNRRSSIIKVIYLV